MNKFIEIYTKLKIKASSIVEVIMALTICMIIFMITMNVILKSQRNNNVQMRQKAQLILSNMNRENLDKAIAFETEQLKISITTEKTDTLQCVLRIIINVMDNSGRSLGNKTLWTKTEADSDVADYTGLYK